MRDDTETCKLMLLNTVGMTIVGHEVVDLWDGSYDEVNYLFVFFVGLIMVVLLSH